MSNRQCRVYILCLVPDSISVSNHTHLVQVFFSSLSFEKLSLLFWIFHCFFFLQFILVGRHHGIFIAMEKTRLNRLDTFCFYHSRVCEKVWSTVIACSMNVSGVAFQTDSFCSSFVVFIYCHK